MRLFSQRKGLKPLEKTIQRDSLDEETRNRVWSVLKVFVWDKWSQNLDYDYDAQRVQKLLDLLWFRFFKKPSDTQPPMHPGEYYRGHGYYDFLRENFFKNEWNDVFDLIEFILANWESRETDALCSMINSVLTEENSAYRLVSSQFVEITNDSEIEEVDAAAQTGLDGVSAHITAAVMFLSDRKNPNYRNSVKESISAVESLFKVLTKNQSATLSDGLKEMKKTNEIHPSLLLGFEKIYAYTSDQGGIRHAIFDTDKTSHSDAKFMLVSCSAFINYVIGKWAESGKKIK
jgi:hypothetical protein